MSPKQTNNHHYLTICWLLSANSL